MCTTGCAPRGSPRRATSGACNFRSSDQNRTKPSSNESPEFMLSFGEGFVQFRPLARKLHAPEVAVYFRKTHRCARCASAHGGQKI